MFIVTYSYKVPKGKTKAYLNLQKNVKAIYLKYGCLSYEIFEKAEKDGEWMEIEKFENRNHFKKVVTKVDNDSEISELFAKFCSIINMRKNPVITKEFVKKI
ncbi:MAG: hypothetical protein AMJ73_00415 [candidate division Zixibacteria bacterium SM1_73]|nr:MAG: hypothetical protein AMJ73_00415 [candidate division Zixibacteria bacterium SM1_73]